MFKELYQRFMANRQIGKIDRLINELEGIQKSFDLTKGGIAVVSTDLYNFLTTKHQLFKNEELDNAIGITLKTRLPTSTDFEGYIRSLKDFVLADYKADIDRLYKEYEEKERYYASWFDNVEGINNVFENLLPDLLLVFNYYNAPDNEIEDETDDSIDRKALIGMDAHIHIGQMVDSIVTISPGFKRFIDHPDFKLIVREALTVLIASYRVKLRSLSGK